MAHVRGEGTCTPSLVPDAFDIETIWTCAMDTQVRRPDPGPCPICGMDMIPLSSDASDATGPGDRIVLSERARMLSNLTTATVRRQAHATADLRLLGRIEPNEASLKP